MCLQNLKALLAHFIGGHFKNSSEQQSALQTGKRIFLLKIKILLSRAEKETSASQRTPKMSCAFHRRWQRNSHAKTKPGLQERPLGEPPRPPAPVGAAAVPGAASAAGSQARGTGTTQPGEEWVFATCPLQPKEEEAPA